MKAITSIPYCRHRKNKWVIRSWRRWVLRGITVACSQHVEEFFLSGGPSSSAEVRVVVIHDIKEVEGVRQQEDKRDEEIRDEVNGEVEEVTQHTHETWR